jgi:protocatechuate 3,4-dioxygenase beta subunit
MQTFSSYLLLAVLVVPSCIRAQEVPPFPTPTADVSETVMLAPKGEPGERLVITGTVYKSDGKTPYPGLVMYLYQTEASGVYNNTDNSWMRPRLHGWVKTDKNGKYKINTIKPGAYPGRRDPAHIHAIVRLPGEQPKWIDDFLFEGDPHLTDRTIRQSASKGSFPSIMKISKEPDGLLRGVRDIRITSGR